MSKFYTFLRNPKGHHQRKQRLDGRLLKLWYNGIIRRFPMGTKSLQAQSGRHGTSQILNRSLPLIPRAVYYAVDRLIFEIQMIRAFMFISTGLSVAKESVLNISLVPGEKLSTASSHKRRDSTEGNMTMYDADHGHDHCATSD